MKTYRMLIEYWVPDEDENLYEERIVKSRSSCGKIADDYLDLLISELQRRNSK